MLSMDRRTFRDNCCPVSLAVILALVRERRTLSDTRSAALFIVLEAFVAAAVVTALVAA